MTETESSGPIRLERRDRLAFRYRVGSVILGLPFLAWSVISSSLGAWTIALFVLFTVGGAISYHLLTSVVRCPSCRARTVNLAIQGSESRRKMFRCTRCGTVAYLTEGFFWQSETSG